MKARIPAPYEIDETICTHCPLSLNCLMGRRPGLAYYCKHCRGFSIPEEQVTVVCHKFEWLYRMEIQGDGKVTTLYGLDSRVFKGTVQVCGACSGVWEHVRGITK